MATGRAPQGRAAWVARHILPHEPALRSWLRRAFPMQDTDDLVQESYCRLAALPRVDGIADARRYLFQTARNVALADLRRARVVRIDAVGSAADMEALLDASDQPSPERAAGARGLLARIEDMMAKLPERARTAIRLRRIEGLSQAEIAAALGVTENIVENDLSRGLRTLLAGLSEEDRADYAGGRGRRGRA